MNNEPNETLCAFRDFDPEPVLDNWKYWFTTARVVSLAVPSLRQWKEDIPIRIAFLESTSSTLWYVYSRLVFSSRWAESWFLSLSLSFVDRTTEWQSNRFTSLYGYGQPMRENQLFRVWIFDSVQNSAPVVPFIKLRDIFNARILGRQVKVNSFFRKFLFSLSQYIENTSILSSALRTRQIQFFILIFLRQFSSINPIKRFIRQYW